VTGTARSRVTDASPRGLSRTHVDGAASFQAWAEVRVPVLRRRAFLLCGNWHTADDLVQDTLIKMYLRWRSVSDGPNPDAYAMRVLMNLHVDSGRRPWRRERARADLPDMTDPGAALALRGVDDQDSLLTSALRRVPLPQRVVLVLRFAEDLSVDQVSETLGISAGTVRSRCSRGNERLRAELTRLGHPAAAVANVDPTAEGQR
jgi:RNA polymerase sigma-70 factor (sigma-E family)